MIEVIYNQFSSNINFSIFAQESYLKCKSDRYGWFVSDSFVIPFIIDKKFIFKRLVFTYEPIGLKEGLTEDAKKNFLNEVVEKTKQSKICDFISMAQSYVVFNICPDNCDRVDWGTYIICLNKSDEEHLSSFDGKHRNVIKKAIKESVIIEQTYDVDIIYTNIKETLERQKSIFYPSRDYLSSLLKNIPNNVAFFQALKDGVIQGTAVIIYDDFSGYYMYGGSISKPITGSVNLLQYEVIRFLRDRGTKYYDLVGARINVKVGSKYEGIQRFKSRFGAELKQGYSFRVIINSFKFRLFNILVKMYGFAKGFNYSDQIDQLKSGKY